MKNLQEKLASVKIEKLEERKEFTFYWCCGGGNNGNNGNGGNGGGPGTGNTGGGTQNS